MIFPRKGYTVYYLYISQELGNWTKSNCPIVYLDYLDYAQFVHCSISPMPNTC